MASNDRTSEFGPSFEAYQCGRQAMKDKKYAEAIEHLERSIKIAPHFKTLELLGECKLEVGEAKDAIVPLAAAAGLGSNEFRANYLLGVAYAKLGNIQAALQFLDRALKMNPQFKKARELRDSLTKS
jgi:tetratricopeptide (TPR) repeat protein